MKPTSKFADPEWRKQRAAKAGAASHTIEAHIKALVDKAPELTDEHKATLRELLQPHAQAGAA